MSTLTANHPTMPNAETCTFQLCQRDKFDVDDNKQGFLDLAIAESHFLDPVLDAKLKTAPSLSHTHLRYEYSYGSLAARHALATFIASTSCVADLAPENIVLSSGCTSGLEILLSAIAKRGDGVLIAAPYYFNFDKVCEMRNGLVPLPFHPPLDTATGQTSITEQVIKTAVAAARAKGIEPRAVLLTNPGNPTGACLTRTEIEQVIRAARDIGLHVIVDEIFAGLVHPADCSNATPFTSALEYVPTMDNVHVVTGLAKVGLAGLKVGAVITHNKQVLTDLVDLTSFCQVSTQTQATIVHIFEDAAFVKDLRQTHARRLREAYDHTTELLDNAGVRYLPAAAGLSVTLDLRAALEHGDPNGDPWEKENELVDGLLRVAKVRVVGGRRFHFATPGYARIVLSQDKEVMGQAVMRIARFCLDRYPLVLATHFRRRLDDMWARTDQVFAMVRTRSEFLARPIDLRHPIIFYLGHLPAFNWNQVKKIIGAENADDCFDTLFERGIDPDVETGECHAHSADIEKDDWPSLHQVFGYRDKVRALIKDGIETILRAANDDSQSGNPMAQRGRVLEMAMEHEMMHQETLLYMFQQLPVSSKHRPSSVADVSRKDGSKALTDEDLRYLPIPAGKAVIGGEFDQVPYGWDNEFPAHEVDVGQFECRRTPVTNGEYLAFINAAGYSEQELWTDSDWDWKESWGLRHPVTWWWHPSDGSAPVQHPKDVDLQGNTGTWYYHTMLEEIPLNQVLSWPVYVSKAEADAFARYTGEGYRLPSEPEWVRLAEMDSVTTAPKGNFGFAQWGPSPVQKGSVSKHGIVDCLGNGWEHTSSAFAPNPGFKEYPEYPGYSSDFFDDKHYVLRGGSWATDAQLIRPSFRNWYQAHYPYVFSKFRLVRGSGSAEVVASAAPTVAPTRPDAAVPTTSSTHIDHEHGLLVQREMSAEGHHYLSVTAIASNVDEKDPPGANTERSALIEFQDHVREGLVTDAGTAKQLSSLYFYDDAGSKIFSEITYLDEYYLTRSEAEVITTHRAQIIHELTRLSSSASGVAPSSYNVIELGCGDGQKTVLLLEELVRQECQFQYLPIDISRQALQDMGALIDKEFAKKRQVRLDMQLVCGDNVDSLKYLSTAHPDAPSLVLFLGSSIGNYSQDGAISFLSTLSSVLKKGDLVLIGFDLIKDFHTMHAAYSDSKGVTREFNLNLLRRMNRELGANFDVDEGFDHVATYNVKLHSMESYLVSTRDQDVYIGALDTTVSFIAHEGIHTETSMKYSMGLIEHFAAKANLDVITHYQTDGKFVDTLMRVR